MVTGKVDGKHPGVVVLLVLRWLTKFAYLWPQKSTKRYTMPRIGSEIEQKLELLDKLTFHQ